MSKARFSGGKLMNVILERFPYRYVECGTLDNGYPDYRIQKFNELTQRYKDMYPVSYTHLTLPTKRIV